MKTILELTGFVVVGWVVFMLIGNLHMPLTNHNQAEIAFKVQNGQIKSVKSLIFALFRYVLYLHILIYFSKILDITTVRSGIP